jgi:hypothetical protein
MEKSSEQGGVEALMSQMAALESEAAPLEAEFKQLWALKDQDEGQKIRFHELTDQIASIYEKQAEIMKELGSA